MTISFLFLGFLFGFMHAFEADHMAAVSVFSERAKNATNAILIGISWGFGHTAVIIVLGWAVLFAGFRLPASVGAWAENGVIILLFILGIQAFARFFRSRTASGGGLVHDHPPVGLHFHPHPSFLVGALHGMAGSAVIFGLYLSSLPSPLIGFLFLLLFGAGSIIGMAALSFAMALGKTKIQKYASLAAGVFSISAGIFLLFP